MTRLVQEPDPRTERGPRREDSTRSSDRIDLGSALVGGLIAAVLVAARLSFSGGETRAETSLLGIVGTSQPVHVQAGAQAQPANTAISADGSATPTSDSRDLAHVANTGGQGVVLRASAREDDRTPRGF